MLNPFILLGIAIQWLVSLASRKAGALVGYLVTTGILLWGLVVYNDGNAIAMFGIRLSLVQFVIACLLWYGFDTRAFIQADSGSEEKVELKATTCPHCKATFGLNLSTVQTIVAQSAGDHSLLHLGTASPEYKEPCPKCKTTLTYDVSTGNVIQPTS